MAALVCGGDRVAMEPVTPAATARLSSPKSGGGRYGLAVTGEGH